MSRHTSRRFALLWPLAASLLLTCPTPAPAQTGSVNNVLQMPQASLPPAIAPLAVPALARPARPRLSLGVTVADESGNPVDWLSPRDFGLRVGGEERQIESLDRGSEHPAAIAVILDVSESLKIRHREPYSRRLAAECVTASTLSMWLARRNPIFIADFARHFHVMEPYTTNDYLLDQAFEQISRDNEFGDVSASLYDSIIKGTVVLAHGPSPRRALIVLTDGDDTISAHGVDDAVAAAERAGVAVYVLVFGSGPFFLPFTGIEAAENYLYHDNLFRITSESGGRGFVIDDRDRASVIRAARKVAEDINGQYLLNFAAPDCGSEAPALELSVKDHPGLEVRAPAALRLDAGSGG